jgi:hypothetical protein
MLQEYSFRRYPKRDSSTFIFKSKEEDDNVACQLSEWFRRTLLRDFSLLISRSKERGDNVACQSSDWRRYTQWLAVSAHLLAASAGIISERRTYHLQNKEMWWGT